MADSTLSIGITAELGALRAQLALIPGITEKEAKAAVAALQTQLVAAEKASKASFDKNAKAAEAAAKKVEADAKTAFTQVSSAAGALSAQVGGAFGRIGSVANSAFRPLYEASQKLDDTTSALVQMGAAGAAGAAGASLAVGAAVELASELVTLGMAAGEAGTHLKDLGLLTDQETEFAGEMSRAVKANSAETDILTVRIGAAVTAIGQMTEAWVGSKAAAADALTATTDLVGGLSKYRTSTLETVPVVGSLANKFIDMWHAASGPGGGNVGIFEPINEGFRLMAERGHTAALAVEDAEERLKKLQEHAYNGDIHIRADDTDQGGYTPAPVPRHIDKKGPQEAAKAVNELRQAEEKLEAEERARASAVEQLQGVYEGLARAQLGPSEQIQADLDAQLRKITELGEKSGDYETAIKAADTAAQIAADKQVQIADAARFAVEDAAKYWDDYKKQSEAAEKSVTATIESEARKQKKARLEAAEAEAEAAAEAVGNIAGNYADLETSIVDGYQARVDAGQHLSVAQVTQANKAIEAAEVAQIAQAGITAAITAATGIATLQEAGVPAPIAIPLGIAEGAGLFAATVAGIRQHRPINFSYNAGGDPTDTNYVTPDAANQGIGTKGGSVPASGDDHGVGMGPRNGSSGDSDRTRRGGGTLTIDRRLSRLVVTSDELGKRPRPGGRRR